MRHTVTLPPPCFRSQEVSSATPVDDDAHWKTRCLKALERNMKYYGTYRDDISSCIPTKLLKNNEQILERIFYRETVYGSPLRKSRMLMVIHMNFWIFNMFRHALPGYTFFSQYRYGSINTAMTALWIMKALDVIVLLFIQRFHFDIVHWLRFC